MSDFIDIVSLSEQKPETSEVKEKPKKAVTQKKSEPVTRGDKDFIQFHEKDLESLNELIDALNFSERVKLLFGQKIEERGKSMEEVKKEGNPNPKKLFRAGLGILMVLLVSTMVFSALKGDSTNQISQKPEATISDNSSTDSHHMSTPQTEWSRVTKTVESELAIYEQEEMRRLDSYLDNRGNRGATISALKTQKSKKENTYQYLTQNKDSYSEAEYNEVEARVIKSIAFTSKALASFDERNSINILKELVRNHINS